MFNFWHFFPSPQDTHEQESGHKRFLSSAARHSISIQHRLALCLFPSLLLQIKVAGTCSETESPSWRLAVKYKKDGKDSWNFSIVCESCNLGLKLDFEWTNISTYIYSIQSWCRGWSSGVACWGFWCAPWTCTWRWSGVKWTEWSLHLCMKNKSVSYAC